MRPSPNSKPATRGKEGTERDIQVEQNWRNAKANLVLPLGPISGCLLGTSRLARRDPGKKYPEPQIQNLPGTRQCSARYRTRRGRGGRGSRLRKRQESERCSTAWETKAPFTHNSNIGCGRKSACIQVGGGSGRRDRRRGGSLTERSRIRIQRRRDRTGRTRCAEPG